MEEFGQEKEHGALIVETLLVLTSSEAMAAMTTSYSCDQEPELAEAYFGLLSTFVRSCPHVMSFPESLFLAYLQLSVIFITLKFAFCESLHEEF